MAHPLGAPFPVAVSGRRGGALTSDWTVETRLMRKTANANPPCFSFFCALARSFAGLVPGWHRWGEGLSLPPSVARRALAKPSGLAILGYRLSRT